MAGVEMRTQQQDYFDRLGDNFEKFMDDYDVSRRCHLVFKDLLKNIDFENKKILEVGAGTGRITEQIVQKKADVTVLDVGESLISRLTERFHCSGVVGDACCLPFEESSFDLVISSECIEHTLFPIQAIYEMCRVCRPGGTICITTPNKLWYPVLWLSMKMKIRNFQGIENWVYPYQVRSAMQMSGVGHIQFSGCHLWPFQIKPTRPFLAWLDAACGRYLYFGMINFGIRGTKL